MWLQKVLEQKMWCHEEHRHALMVEVARLCLTVSGVDHCDVRVADAREDGTPAADMPPAGQMSLLVGRIANEPLVFAQLVRGECAWTAPTTATTLLPLDPFDASLTGYIMALAKALGGTSPPLSGPAQQKFFKKVVDHLHCHPDECERLASALPLVRAADPAQGVFRIDFRESRVPDVERATRPFPAS
ncbi:hypothetical protein CDL60_12365 [Roseateles noduli]|nr:hypothetical protein CDL60_12365 [Roseateles noduli]